MKEQISQESRLSLTRYKSSLLNCIPSLRTLAFIVPEKSLREKFNIGLYGRKMENERTNKPRKPIVSYTDISHHYCTAYQV